MRPREFKKVISSQLATDGAGYDRFAALSRHPRQSRFEIGWMRARPHLLLPTVSGGSAFSLRRPSAGPRYCSQLPLRRAPIDREACVESHRR